MSKFAVANHRKSASKTRCTSRSSSSSSSSSSCICINFIVISCSKLRLIFEVVVAFQFMTSALHNWEGLEILVQVVLGWEVCCQRHHCRCLNKPPASLGAQTTKGKLLSWGATSSLDHFFWPTFSLHSILYLTYRGSVGTVQNTM